MSEHSAAQRTRRILLLTSSTRDDPEFLRALSAQGTVHTVTSLEDALRALHREPFDVVVTAAADLLALSPSDPADHGAGILDVVGHGVCVVDRAGHMVWANPKLRSYPDETVEAVRRACAELCSQLAAEQAPPEHAAGQQRALSAAGYEFDLTVSPSYGPDGQLERVVALAFDVTATRRLEQRVRAIEAAGRELVRLDVEAVAEMDVEERLQLLEDRIIRFGRELLQFDHFVIRVLDKQTCRLDTVFAEGLSEAAKSLEIYAMLEGNGISGYVAATGHSCICPDVTQDPRYLPGLDQARSSLTVPLLLRDQVIGILNAESDTLEAFTEDDRRIAEIFGHYIAIALHTLQLLAVERHTTAGQVVSDAAAELATPLNNIVVQATALLEQFADDESVCRRARAVVAGVEQVKQAMQAMSEQPEISGLLPEQPCTDPVLAGKRILVADDEEIIRETIADMLSRNGALTAVACDGNEAVALIRSQGFDLVLSDIKMPYRNGYEVFAVSCEVNPRCPVILITGFGYDPNHSIVRASNEGLAGVLFKPFKVDKLMDEVRQALTATAP